MKLHLPLPLRRALYRTFALSLAGAACSIGNATEYTMDEKNNFLPTSPVTLGNGDKIIWNSANNDYNIGAWSNKEYTLTLAAGGDWGMDGNFKGTLHLGNASGTATPQNNVILNVTGGTYITNNVITCQYGHDYPNGATINVSGGTLQINDLIAENGGWTTLNISGGTFTAKSIKSEGVNEAPASKGIAIRVSGGTANLGHLWTDTNPPPRHATLLWTGGKLSVNAQYNVDATFGVNNQNTTLTTTGDLSLPQMVNVLGNVTLDITNGGSASLAGGVSKAITVKNGTASNNLNQNKKISWNGVSASWTGSYTVSNGNLVDGDANQAQKLAVHSGTLTLTDSLLDSLTIGGGPPSTPHR